MAPTGEFANRGLRASSNLRRLYPTAIFGSGTIQKSTEMSPAMINEYRWEYSPLARTGNALWERAIDPLLRLFADDELTFLRRLRGVIQVVILAAVILLLAAFKHPTHLVTASGLLFDIAGALRLFLLDELTEALEPFKERESLPSVAMRELIMPEASGPYTAESPHMSLYFYNKRGVLLLFLGFTLQMIGDFVG